MASRSTFKAVSIAAVAGVALWWVATLLTSKREPWDAAVYWVLAYPLAVLTCTLLGYKYPERSWRWPLVLFEAQFIAMCVRSGELGSLWPMGMLLFAVLSVPGIVAARWAARLGTASAGRNA
jgi:hypothetical protein